MDSIDGVIIVDLVDNEEIMKNIFLKVLTFA